MKIKKILQHPLTITAFIAIIHLLFLSYFLILNHEDPSILHRKTGSNMWYDGYFFQAIAVNPLTASPSLDIPAFRYQRIIYPLFARILAFGQPTGIDWTLLLLTIGSVITGVWLLARLLKEWGMSVWYAAVYGLFIGQFIAIRFDTSEPLAYLFVLLAITAHEHSRYRLTTLLFAIAILTKELAILFWLGYVIYWFYKRNWQRVVLLGSAIIPYLLFQFVLLFWLGKFGFAAGGAGLAMLPFSGYLTRTFEPSMALFPLIFILPALLSVGLGGHHIYRHGITALSIALILNALLIIFMPEESTGEIRATGRIALGLVLAITLWGGENQHTRTENYSLLWIPLSIVYLFSLLHT